MGSPCAPRAVRVMGALPPPAVIGDVALTVDCAAEIVPTLTTTEAVCVIATALIVAETAFEPAAVELRVPVATPLASGVAPGWGSVFPAGRVAERKNGAPWIWLPLAAFSGTG